MRRMLNTLFVMTPETYLSLNNDNVVVNLEKKILGQFPLHTLEQIMYFGYRGASPALMGACAKYGVGLSFFSINGRFLAKVGGEAHGNVLLRKEQYRISDGEALSCLYARNFIAGKILNSRKFVSRIRRDHALSVDVDKLCNAEKELLNMAKQVRRCQALDEVRGYEGEAASIYFSCFNDFILHNKKLFNFSGRIRRPPTDPVNALLSFMYTVLANDCASALEGVGLDSYVGFLHRDRPGRKSLALDLMEEFRCIFVDRFVIFLLNNRMLTKSSFEVQEDGAVLLSDSARKTILSQWQARKQEQITHPFLEEKMAWGLVMQIQAMLLARCVRGDLTEYPAFLWN